MTADELNDLDRTWPQYALGTHKAGGDEATAALLHESPPDQESIKVILLESFICCEAGKVLEIQRHQFRPFITQEHL